MTIFKFLGNTISFGLFTILLFLTKSCFYYEDMTHLTDEELQWMDCVEKYPKPRFVSPLGDTANMIYEELIIRNDTSRFHFKLTSNYMTSYEAHAYYSYHLSTGADDISGLLWIEKPVESNLLVVWGSLNHFSTHKNKNSRDTFIPLKPVNTIIDSIRYDHCLVFDTLNAHYNHIAGPGTKNKIDKFIINRKHGLMYYRYADGREYFRILEDTLVSRLKLKK